MEVAEYVSNAGAGNSLDGAAALPDAEGHLQVLTTPTVHLFVVAAHFPEVATIYGKQSAGHGGTVCWADLPLLLALASLALLLPLRQIDPVKVAIPLESADLEGFVAICAVLKVVGIDDIDNGHQHASPRLLDALQEWLAPANVTLAMGVQEDEHIPVAIRAPANRARIKPNLQRDRRKLSLCYVKGKTKQIYWVIRKPSIVCQARLTPTYMASTA